MEIKDTIVKALHENFAEFTDDQANAVIEALKLEGFVLVPRELSDGKADAQALLAWGCHAGLFKSQNWDMSALRVEEFRLKWCKSKARELQEEYRVAIKAQEQGHD